MHGMGKGAQALRVCLRVGLEEEDDHPGSSRIYVVGRVVLGGWWDTCLRKKLPLLAFLSLCALTGAWWWVRFIAPLLRQRINFPQNLPPAFLKYPSN